MDQLNSKLTLVIADLQMQLKRAEKEVRSWKATAEKSGEGIEEKLLGERKNYLKIIDGMRRDMSLLRKEAREGVQLKADVSGYIKQLEKAHREIDGLKVAQEELAKADRLRNLGMNRKPEAIRPQRGGVADTALGVGLGGLGFLAMERFGSTVINTAGSIRDAVVQMDSMQRALSVVEGSSEGARKRLEELKKLAESPGLGVAQAAEGYVRLRSVGMNADEAKKALAEMGNALAAVGSSSADLDGVVLALTQIISKGKVSAEEINQIAERVPQVRAVMQNVFGTADTEVLQKMNLTAEDFVNRLMDGFGTQVPRALDSLQNQLDNTRDLWMQIADEVGNSVVGTLIPEFQEFSKVVQDWPEMGRIGAKAYGEELKSLGVDMGFLYQLSKALAADFFIPTDGLKAFDKAKKDVQQLLDAQKQMRDVQRYQERLSKPNLSDQERFQIMRDFAGQNSKKPAISRYELPKTKTETESEKAAQKELNELRKEGAQIDQQLSGLAQQRLDLAWAQMKPEEQLKQIRQDIADKQSLIDSGMLNQTTRLDVESQVLSLKLQELRTQQQIADEEERSKREQAQKNKEAAARSLSLAEYKEELRIQTLLNDGKTKQAEAAQRDLDIQREKRRLMEQMHVSEQEALRLATQRVDLERQSQNGDGGRYDSNGMRSDGRKRIVSNRDGSTVAPDAPGNRSGLDQFYERNNRKTRLNEEFNTPGLDEMNRRGPLRDTFKFPGLDAYNEMQNRSQDNAAKQDANGAAGRNAGLAQQAFSLLQENLPQILQALQLA